MSGKWGGGSVPQPSAVAATRSPLVGGNVQLGAEAVDPLGVEIDHLLPGLALDRRRRLVGVEPRGLVAGEQLVEIEHRRRSFRGTQKRRRGPGAAKSRDDPPEGLGTARCRAHGAAGAGDVGSGGHVG